MQPIQLDTSSWPHLVVTPPRDEVADAQLEAFMDEYYGVIFGQPEAHVLILDLRGNTGLTPTQRRYLTDSMQKTRHDHSVAAGVALVFDSAVLRGMLTAMLWVAKPRCAVEVFSGVNQARAWADVQLRTARRAG